MGAKSPQDDDEDENAKELQLESLLCAFESLGKAWPRNPETQRRFNLVKPKTFRIKIDF